MQAQQRAWRCPLRVPHRHDRPPAPGTARHGHALLRMAGHVHRLSSWPPKWARSRSSSGCQRPTLNGYVRGIGKESRADPRWRHILRLCRDAATKPGDWLQDWRKDDGGPRLPCSRNQRATRSGSERAVAVVALVRIMTFARERTPRIASPSRLQITPAGDLRSLTPAEQQIEDERRL